jgi:hypothetical protein
VRQTQLESNSCHWFSTFVVFNHFYFCFQANYLTWPLTVTLKGHFVCLGAIMNKTIGD